MPSETLQDGGEAVTLPRSSESIQVLTALAGAALVAIGGYLPWLQHNPDYEGVGIMLTPQTTAGFEWADLVLMVPVALLVAFLALRGSTKWWARATVAVGSMAVSLPVLRAWNQYANFDGYYAPDVGLAVTVVGGVLLLMAGGYDRYTAD